MGAMYDDLPGHEAYAVQNSDAGRRAVSGLASMPMTTPRWPCP